MQIELSVDQFWTQNNTRPHIVKRDELEKAIRFLKGLVGATEQ
jgi:hypothetical protein